MKRLTQGALIGMLLLVLASLAAAQQVSQPVCGSATLSSGNDVFHAYYRHCRYSYKRPRILTSKSRARDRVPAESIVEPRPRSRG